MAENPDGADLLEAIREAAGNAGIGLAVTLTDTTPPRSVYLNGRAEELLGRSSAEVERIGVWGCLAPEEVEAHRRRHERQVGQPVDNPFETIALRPNGERVPLEISYSEAVIDGRQVAVSFLFDLRERRRALEALNESEARFRHVIENAPDGVAILRGTKVIFLNRRAADMLGLGRVEEGYGRRITEFLRPDDAEQAGERIAKLFRTGASLPDPAEYRSRSIAGRELTVEISSIPIELDGAPAVIAFARDVTERKAIQARLAQADRLSALGVLSAGVAHEINNPLAYVLLNLEFLERELTTLPVASAVISTLTTHLENAKHGAERVAAVVRDLDTFVRGDEGLLGPVQVAKALDAAVATAGPELCARVVRRYGEARPVRANENRLEQVCLNLLINAAHAMPKTERATNVIELSVSGDSEWVRLDVRDNGAGMSRAVLSRIFDPFFTTKPPGMGTGLGLPICQSIVRALGGEITVASAPGQGSCFSVKLPVWKGALGRADAAAPSHARSGARGRVMIVDDEVAVGRTLGLVIGADHEVTVVNSGAEALAALQRDGADAYDAVLCDVAMPGMSGIDLLRWIERTSPDLSRRVVLMTGGLSPGGPGSLRELPNVLLEKPFDIDLVRATLAKLVDARKSHIPAEPS